ncbi:MAG: hypothetical protein J0H06_02440 [Actinobacteria bacterium]|nr:hypothetical protein [Actinomycetota bacterium]
MRTSTSPGVALIRAQANLAERRLRSPSRVANVARNTGAERGRHDRWKIARDSFWGFAGPYLREGDRVAILGAGNGDDLPLERIAALAGEVTLIDLDLKAPRAARRRLSWRLRRRVAVIGHEATGGAADTIAVAAALGEVPGRISAPEAPLPGGPYDLAVGDLLYSQLLYPALLDLGVEERRREAFLERYCPILTRGIVARLHASAPTVVHIHDPLAWWEGHEQTADLDQILRLAEGDDIGVALGAVARGLGPVESDPRAALRSFGIEPRATALWRWPFSPGVDYLACATLTGERVPT